MRKVLELPAFRRLLIAWTVNELAISIGAVALAIFIFRRTGSATGAMAFFLCAQFAPALISPLVVARLDQRGNQAVLGLLYGLEGFIFLLLALLVDRLSVVGILALVLIDGSLAVTARALSRAAWTSVTTEAGLMREASALINASLTCCLLLGPAFGGVLVATGGTQAALALVAGAFALITITVATARGLPSAARERVPAKGRVRSAARYARSEPLIRRLLSLEALGILFFTVSVPVEVVFVQHTLRAGPDGYGVLLSTWGGGAIVGSTIYARWRAVPARRLMTIGSVCLGLGFLTMAVAPGVAIALAGAAIGGLGNGMQVVAMRTALQAAVSDAWMALVLSFNESMFQAVPGAGIVLGGAITAIAGPRAGLAVGGGGSLAVAILMWFGLPSLLLDEPVPQKAALAHAEPG